MFPVCFPTGGGRLMKLSNSVAATIQLAPGKTDQIFWDDALPGFGLRVRQGGKKTWIAQFRVGAQQRRLKLGDAAVVLADPARQAAKTQLAKVHLGHDPAATKAEERAKTALTFGATVERYINFKTPRVRANT